VRTAIASVVLLAGAAFMFVAGLGVARFPDLYTRMHAATKPATVGVVAVMSGVALALYEVPVTARAALVAMFFLLTSPVAAHAIARSAHTRRVPLARGTRVEVGDAAASRAWPSSRGLDDGPEPGAVPGSPLISAGEERVSRDAPPLEERP
jgi:multicomponent Na+:H+ antiporter subunit G